MGEPTPMNRLIIALVMLPVFAFANTFIWTNETGRLQFSTSHSDAINGAVGAIVTSAVPPRVAREKSGLQKEARSVRTNMTVNINDVQATTPLTNGFTAAQNRQLVNDLRRELLDTQRELRDLAGIVRQLLNDEKDD